MTSDPFVLAVLDERLADLHERLLRTPWPARWPDTNWEAGVDPDEPLPLFKCWRDGYDWRLHEAKINTLDNYLIDVDGTGRAVASGFV